MTRALSASNKEAKLLVEFTYGDPDAPSCARFTTWSEDLTVDGDVYTSEPRIGIELGGNTGSLDDKPSTITLPLVASGFADTISTGEPFSPIPVTVRELLDDPTSGATGDDLTLYAGHVKRTTRRVLTVELQCGSAKGKLNVASGIPCNNQCQWTLGDISCKVDIEALVETATVGAIDQRTVTTTAVSAFDATYYSRGYMRRGGLRIGIRSWSEDDPLVFELVTRPPAAWLGQLVEVVPGCAKSIEICRGRFSNESNFGGMGFPMPSWHPVIEGP